MSFQVLARKWRPQRFDDVVGQQATTRTLKNAITSGRVAQAFVFAGARGCGKTTTARILARALNCVKGPTPDPCGECDACLEIAQGRDIDVLEIDAASHTGIDNIREVVIAGLSIAPARDRYKVFIIDEVHQLSAASFNALLKSIEEPPPHVVFMMATTELHKIPDTILSRSQVYEFRTIPTNAIAAQLKTIAAAEGIEVPEAALMLMARAAEGSMRDAQSAFDQVIAFAGLTITGDDVSTVLGLVGRDLLFDIIEAVVDEDAPKAFALADRATESGHDLRLVCRELAGVIRDMTIVSIDPSRVSEAGMGEADAARLSALATRFSREDLMRAFDVLSRAEQDIRAAAQPRFHFEMALLRWMHLRKLVPLADLLAGGPGAASPARPGLAVPPKIAPPKSAPPKSALPARPAASALRPSAAASSVSAPSADTPSAPVTPANRPATAAAPAKAEAPGPADSTAAAGSGVKDALLAEVRTAKPMLHNMAIAMAQRIDASETAITFTFAANHNVARAQLEQNREWLELLTERLTGRRIPVRTVQAEAVQAAAVPAEGDAPPAAGASNLAAGKPARDLRAEAMASASVQAVLDVFPAELGDVEEM
ncbi:MAG: DNA polymerase III subunit gamma/tau [Vicinamibacterales bacterium]